MAFDLQHSAHAECWREKQYLLLLCILHIATSATTATKHPSCFVIEGYTCDHQYDENFPSDPTTCSTPSRCPTCLSGWYNQTTDTGTVSWRWEEKLKELGAHTTTRSLRPYVVMDNWLSAELVDSIAYILLRETMGFDPIPAPYGWFFADIPCCDRPLIIWERWVTPKIFDDEAIRSTVSSLNIGYEGTSSLYVPSITVNAYPMANLWSAYRYLPEYGSIFPRAFSTPCEMLIVNETLGCVEGNYWCDTNLWTGGSCDRGRWVPPQCRGANVSRCQEVYHASPQWDPAYYENVIRNTGMNFVVAYVGYVRYSTFLTNRTKLGLHSIFYWFQPDPLLQAVDAVQMIFKKHSVECQNAYTTDCETGGNDCAFETTLMQKTAGWSTLNQDSDLAHFFSTFQIRSSNMASMLKQHVSAGGSKQVYNISCQWIKDNFNLWRDFVHNSGLQSDSQKQFPYAIVFAVSGSCVAILLVVVGAALWRTYRRNMFAPKLLPVTILFTDIEGSTHLWQQHGGGMKEAVDLHHRIVRRLIEEHHCYEVKTLGDAFMIACPTAVTATYLAIAIQTELNRAAWPKGMEHPYTTFANDECWRGLRVRIGYHECRDDTAISYDGTHQRWDYSGHSVTTGQRVSAKAVGGQILTSKETMDVVRKDVCFDILQMEAVFAFVGSADAKELDDGVTLVSVLPNKLCDRVFSSNAKCEVVVIPHGDGETNSVLDSRELIVSTLLTTLDCLPSIESKTAVVERIIGRRCSLPLESTSYAVRRAIAAATLIRRCERRRNAMSRFAVPSQRSTSGSDGSHSVS